MGKLYDVSLESPSGKPIGYPKRFVAKSRDPNPNSNPVKQHSNLCGVLTIVGACFLFVGCGCLAAYGSLLFYKESTRPTHEVTKSIHKEPLAAKPKPPPVVRVARKPTRTKSTKKPEITKRSMPKHKKG